MRRVLGRYDYAMVGCQLKAYSGLKDEVTPERRKNAPAIRKYRHIGNSGVPASSLAVGIIYRHKKRKRAFSIFKLDEAEKRRS